jgi:hypothetical protein
VPTTPLRSIKIKIPSCDYLCRVTCASTRSDCSAFRYKTGRQKKLTKPYLATLDSNTSRLIGIFLRRLPRQEKDKLRTSSVIEIGK